jgi:hypothetical protein
VGDKVQEGNCGWGNVLSRQQGKITGKGHTSHEGVHEQVGLEMEVAKHFIRAPATNEMDDVGVNAGAKEGHGTAGTKAAGG